MKNSYEVFGVSLDIRGVDVSMLAAVENGGGNFAKRVKQRIYLLF